MLAEYVRNTPGIRRAWAGVWAGVHERRHASEQRAVDDSRQFPLMRIWMRIWRLNIERLARISSISKGTDWDAQL